MCRSLLILSLLLASLIAILAGEIHHYGSRIIQTDMQQLLPKDEHLSNSAQTALNQQQTQFNQDVVALIGHENTDSAKKIAHSVSQQWQKSGLFQQVHWQFGQQYRALQQSAQQLSSYLLSTEKRQLLIHHPERYAAQRAASIANPFTTQLLPLSQDLLGFSEDYRPPKAYGNLNLDPQDGSLSTSASGKTWILIRAQLRQSGISATETSLLPLMQQTRSLIHAQQADIHLAAPALFNAEGKAKGSTEGTRLSLIGIFLTLLFFFLIFGRLRLLLLLLPAICGLLAGITTTIVLFQGIHLLTLIIGSSLLGLLLDMPLHWLGKSLYYHDFDGKTAMRALRRPFFASTTVTLLGYSLLLAAPLPILKQTAIYSSIALITAVLTAYITLPALFQHFRPRRLLPIQTWLANAQHVLNRATSPLKPTTRRIPLLLLLIIATTLGLLRSQWQDNIADWVTLNPTLVHDMQRVSEISGANPSSDFILTHAKNTDALLALNQKIQQTLVSPSLNIAAFAVSRAAQEATKAALKTQTPQDWQALEKVGFAAQTISNARETAANRPTLSLEQALSTPLGEPWRHLYLGKIDGEYFAIIRPEGSIGTNAQTMINSLPNAQWINPRAQISAGFTHTKHIALQLKLLSYLLAFALLTWLYGIRQAVKMLLIPLLAVILTISIMGWLGIPISAFAVFGLLLVMAIGVDYAIYAQSSAVASNVRLAGILLALITTLLTFGLLLFSSTPIVVSFGASVSIGIFLSAFIAILTLKEG